MKGYMEISGRERWLIQEGLTMLLALEEKRAEARRDWLERYGQDPDRKPAMIRRIMEKVRHLQGVETTTPRAPLNAHEAWLQVITNAQRRFGALWWENLETLCEEQGIALCEENAEEILELI